MVTPEDIANRMESAKSVFLEWANRCRIQRVRLTVFPVMKVRVYAVEQNRQMQTATMFDSDNFIRLLRQQN